MKTIKILAISGSLRANSSNNAVLNACVQFLPEDVTMELYGGLGSLPHFDDNTNPPGTVLDLRQRLLAADGVIICSPEYAFGVPGSLKNALDWTVSSGELVGKPLALITAATGGANAHAALQLIFKALSSNLPETSMLLIPFIRAKMNDQSEVVNPDTLRDIKNVIESLIESILEDQASNA